MKTNPTIDETPSLKPCLYCSGINFSPLYGSVRDRLGYVPGEWSFVRCLACGSANLRPFPRDEEIPGFYPNVYTFSPQAGQGRLRRLLSRLEYQVFFRNTYRAQVTRIESLTNSRAGSNLKLLDIGCGHGLRLREFQRRGYDVQGMDFVPESVEYVKQLGIPAVCTDMTGLAGAFEPAWFDVITAFYVLEHVTNVRQALEASLVLIKPGGWFIGAVPLIDSVQAEWFGGRHINVCEAPRHISLPSRQGICDLARQVGFRNETVQVFPDSLLACAGAVGLSLVPGASTTQVYGAGRLRGIVSRLLGAGAVAMSLPWVWLENYYFKRPVLGFLVAQRAA